MLEARNLYKEYKTTDSTELLITANAYATSSGARSCGGGVGGSIIIKDTTTGELYTVVLSTKQAGI